MEITFARLKEWRRIATGNDRSAHFFFSAICIAAAVTFWLAQSGPPDIHSKWTADGRSALGQTRTSASGGSMSGFTSKAAPISPSLYVS
jgi:hypothetical protein